MDIISVVGSKGGIGKTTLTANLGALLAHFGLRVLLVDADIQPALSSFYPIKSRAPDGLLSVFHTGEIQDAAISQTAIENLDIVLSDDPDSTLPQWILLCPDGRMRLRYAVRRLAEDDLYDVVLIDSQGALGPCMDAAALAATYLVSPVPPEMLSAREFLRGTIDALYTRLKSMERMGVTVGPTKAILYRMTRTSDARQISAMLREDFAENRRLINVSFLNTVVPHSAAYTTAASMGVPVHIHGKRRDSTSSPSSTPSPCEVLHNIVWELYPALDGRYADSEDTDA